MLSNGWDRGFGIAWDGVRYALLDAQLLLPHAPDVSLVPVSRPGLMAGWIIVSLAQTRVLNSISRPIHYYAFQGQRQQLGVVNIGSSHHQAQWPSIPVDQDTPLAARLAPVRGIATY